MDNDTHQLIPEERLREKILLDIRLTHRLQFCPLCGCEFKNTLCSLGAPINSKWKSDVVWKSCFSCRIVWKLSIINWTKERGDGAVINEGHDLMLHGYSSCFCRTPLIGLRVDRGISLEHNESGHASLNLHCPSPA